MNLYELVNVLLVIKYFNQNYSSEFTLKNYIDNQELQLSGFTIYRYRYRSCVRVIIHFWGDAK